MIQGSSQPSTTISFRSATLFKSFLGCSIHFLITPSQSSDQALLLVYGDFEQLSVGGTSLGPSKQTTSFDYEKYFKPTVRSETEIHARQLPLAMENTYFVCTLGQARNGPRTTAKTVPEFLELQAERYRNLPAVGIARPEPARSRVISFQELNCNSKDAARALASQIPLLKTYKGQEQTIALLSHSNMDFLDTWLGLIRLGFSVLMLASQLDKGAIEALCSQQNVRYLFHDDDHLQTAEQVQGVQKIHMRMMRLSQLKIDPEVEFLINSPGDMPRIPYLGHSSGTSSGKPKVIPQSNAAAFTAAPSLSPQAAAATFSSTPLYHGGVADCFRAWTSGQMIWLFPGGDFPITARTVTSCLNAIDKSSLVDSSLRVKYFSSVPYVLKDLAENSEGLDLLRKMEIVGVGGAAFPATLGHELVSQGVRLVSRYGSAECGFLLSSYRNFQDDSDWDYLRSETGAECLVFEPQDNGLFELVVKPGWPHMAKTNRDDGSYATADLFEKHPTKPSTWRYHSRADAQIILVSGKKFDPEPIESAVISRSESNMLTEFLIFGDGESHPGALAFVQSNQEESETDLLDRVWKTIDKINAENPSHARLSKGMLKIMLVDRNTGPPLEKSSKGTIVRSKALVRYRDDIKQVYEGTGDQANHDTPIKSRSDLVAVILHLIAETTSKELAEDDDFFEQGIDSISCVQIRKRLKVLLETSGPRNRDQSNKAPNQTDDRPGLDWLSRGDLPSNLLYDCGTTGQVADFLIGSDQKVQEDEASMMKELSLRYSHFKTKECIPSTSNSGRLPGSTILLTGATGALGTHLLDILRSRPGVTKIYCLIRASDVADAHSRLDTALKNRAKAGLEPFSSVEKNKVVCTPSNLARQDLGIDESLLLTIKSTVNIIIHAAWAVNFTLKFKTFEFHLAGTQNLLNLGFAAAQLVDEGHGRGSTRFLFCSSIASVTASTSLVVKEEVSQDPSDASPLGYSRSKWAAEQICQIAQDTAAEAHVPLEVDILRIGQLCGDWKHGIWNQSEAWPLMLSTFDVCSALPDLPHEVLNWLPVDVAAKAVVEIAERSRQKVDPEKQASVYHVLNSGRSPTWTDMLQWLQREVGEQLQILPTTRWLAVLEEELSLHHVNHPSGRLLEVWKAAYLSHGETSDKTQPSFDVMGATGASESLRNMRPVSEALVLKMWNWVRKNITVDE